jgi:uncharacterized membrane protein
MTIEVVNTEIKPDMPATNNNTELKETSRVEMFSDGVFAIAITLLVLELIQILHPAADTDLLTTALNHWQSFLAFFIGFVTILVCWINHHVAFEYIHKVDTNFLWVNGFLLFIVTLTPFSTAVFAEYIQKETTTAVAVFGFNYILISIAAYGICYYTYNKHLILEKDRAWFRAYKLIYYYGVYYTIIAFLICFVSTWTSIFLYIVLFTAFAVPKNLTSMIQRIKRKKKKIKVGKSEPVSDNTNA